MHTKYLSTILLAITLFSCSSEDTTASDPCLSSGVSSTNDDTRIHSEREGCAAYKNITVARSNFSGTAGSVTLDYMLHTAVGTAKGLLILIAGGDLDTKIRDDDMDGVPDFASGNFLVRSAHLFADQGYQVVTMDRPSDYIDYNLMSSSEYDAYRTSAAHGTDIQAMIDAENTSGLPIFIAGTSRGAISAVTQFNLASAIVISSPVTSGAGQPVIFGSIATDPASVTVPVHVLWHQNDGCSVSTPAASAALISNNDFSNSSNVGSNMLSGGFNRSSLDPVLDVCKGQALHGFMGIEVEAVQATTIFLDGVVSTL